MNKISGDKIALLLLALLVLGGGTWFVLFDTEDDSDFESSSNPIHNDLGAKASRRQEKDTPQVTNAVLGQIVDSENLPLAGVEIRLGFSPPPGVSPDTDLPPALTTYSGADGRFKFEAQGYWVLKLTVQPPRQMPRQLNALLMPSEPMDFGRIIFSEGLALSGRVVDDETDEAIAGAQVRIGSRGATQSKPGQPIFHGGIDAERSREITSNAQGRFSASGLDRGRLSMSVTASGFAAAAIDDFAIDELDLEDFEFRLRIARPLRVVVRGKNGDPLAGAVVRITGVGYHASDKALQAINNQTRRTKSTGEASFGGLRRRRLRLRVQADGYRVPKDRMINADEVEVDVLMEEGGSVFGVVRAKESGAALEKVEIRANLQSFRNRRRQNLKVLRGLEASESFDLSPTPGSFGIAGVESSRLQLEFSAPGRVSGFIKIQGLKSGELRRLNVDLSLESRMTGRVMSHDYKVLPGAKVTAERIGSDDGSEEAALALLGGGLNSVDPALGHAKLRPARTIRVETDDAGNFELAGLSGGRYRLFATHPEQLSAPPQEYTVEIGKRVGDIELQTRPAGGVEGFVYSPQGKPLAGCEVLLKTTPPKDAASAFAAELLSRNLRRTWADAKGYFKMTGIAPGNYGLVANPPEFSFRDKKGAKLFERASTRLRIRPGALVSIELRLKN